MQPISVIRHHPRLNLPWWKYKNRNMIRLEDFPQDSYGFVYILKLKLDGKVFRYIGKKNLYQECQMSKLKSGEERKGHISFFCMRKNGHLVEMERIMKESNWKDYTGSSDIEGYEIVKRTISDIAFSGLELTYLEARAIMVADAIRKKNFLNSNVLGKFYAANFRKMGEHTE